MDIAINLKGEEQDYIEACIRKERWAQQQLYIDFYPSMMSLCLRYASNSEDALDILHEGFIKVFKHIGKYQVGTSLHSWIRRIMVNTAIDFYRKTVRRRTDDIETAYHVSSDEPTAVSRMTADEIMDALKQLSTAYRTVFNLYIIEGYSHKEIAKLLDITESTSRSNLVKARSKLRQILMAREINYER